MSSKDVASLHPGDRVDVRALKSDGHAYRWWEATIESVHDDHIVTIARVGNVVSGTERGWITKYPVRSYHWFARPYALSEIYHPNGELLEIYVHIASPTEVSGHRLIYTDLELDVVYHPGQPPEIVDEDEFAEAAVRYGYAPEFQAACRQAAGEAIDLVLGWQVGGSVG